MHNLIRACEAQVRLEPIDPDNLHQMSQESKDQVRSIVTNFGTAVQGKPSNEPNNDINKPKVWKIWTLEFEGM